MGEQRAAFQVIVGPNEGDTLHVETGACRLLGRHLSEHETVLMDPEGNRELDAGASEMLSQRLGERGGHGGKAHAPAKPPARSRAANPDYQRGPDVILADSAISRAHAMLFVDKGGAGIVDLASTNGTYVNNKRIASAMLEHGDVIAVGSSEIAVTVRSR